MKELSVAALLLVCMTTSNALAYEAMTGPLGVLRNDAGATDGYVLILPQNSKTTYLIDNDGNIVNTWVSEFTGFYGELLPNGNLARLSRMPNLMMTSFGGAAGLLEEFDWNGNKVWEYEMHEPGKEVSHHFFEVMPNGNYAMLGWEYRSYDEAIAKGLDPTNMDGRTVFPDGITVAGEHTDGIWPDFIREVDRNTKETVWEWRIWDHVGTAKDQLDINKFLHARVYRLFSGPD